MPHNGMHDSSGVVVIGVLDGGFCGNNRKKDTLRWAMCTISKLLSRNLKCQCEGGGMSFRPPKGCPGSKPGRVDSLPGLWNIPPPKPMPLCHDRRPTVSWCGAKVRDRLQRIPQDHPATPIENTSCTTETNLTQHGIA